MLRLCTGVATLSPHIYCRASSAGSGRRRGDALGHRLQDAAEIAVRRNHGRRVVLKCGLGHAEGPLEQIKILRTRRAERRRVNARRFGIRFTFDLQSAAIRGRCDRSDFALFLAVDVCGFAFAFGTEARRDLVALARHTIVDFRRDRRVVFAALEA